MKLIKTAAITVSYLVTTASVALAAPTVIQNPATRVGTDNIGSLFATIFYFLIGIVGAIAVIFIVIGGIRYILAGGNEKSTMAARNMITAALIGLVIALLAVVIVFVVSNVLGYNTNFITNPTTNPSGV